MNFNEFQLARGRMSLANKISKRRRLRSPRECTHCQDHSSGNTQLKLRTSLLHVFCSTFPFDEDLQLISRVLPIAVEIEFTDQLGKGIGPRYSGYPEDRANMPLLKEAIP